MPTPTNALFPDLESDVADRHLDAALLDKYLKFEKEQEGWGHPDTRQQGPIGYLIDQVASNKRSVHEAGTLIDLWYDKAWTFDQSLVTKGERNFAIPAAANILRHTKEGREKAEAIQKKRVAKQEMRQINEYRDRVMVRYQSQGGSEGPLLKLAIECVKEKSDPQIAARQLDAWVTQKSRQSFPAVDAALVTPEVQDMAMEILGRSTFGVMARKELQVPEPDSKGEWNPKGMTKLKVDRGEDNPNNAVAGLSADAVYLEHLYRQREQVTGVKGPLHHLANTYESDPGNWTHLLSVLTTWMTSTSKPQHWEAVEKPSSLTIRNNLLLESQWGKNTLKQRDEMRDLIKLPYTPEDKERTVNRLMMNEAKVRRFHDYLGHGIGLKFLANLTSQVAAGILTLDQAARIIDRWALSDDRSLLPPVTQTGSFTEEKRTAVRNASALHTAYTQVMDTRTGFNANTWKGMDRRDLLTFLWSNDSLVGLAELPQAKGFLRHLSAAAASAKSQGKPAPITNAIAWLYAWMKGQTSVLTSVPITREGLIRQTGEEILRESAYNQVARDAFPLTGLGEIPNRVYFSVVLSDFPEKAIKTLEGQSAIQWFAQNNAANTPLDHLAHLLALQRITPEQATDHIHKWLHGKAVTLPTVDRGVSGDRLVTAMKVILSNVDMNSVLTSLREKMTVATKAVEGDKARNIIREQILGTESPLGVLSRIVGSGAISVETAQDKFARWVKGERLEFRDVPPGNAIPTLRDAILNGLDLESLISARIDANMAIAKPTVTFHANSGTIQDGVTTLAATLTSGVEDIAKKVDEMAKKVQSVEAKVDEAVSAGKMKTKVASEGTFKPVATSLDDLFADLDGQVRGAAKTASAGKKVATDEDQDVDKMSAKEFPEWMAAIGSVDPEQRPKLREQLAQLADYIPETSQLKGMVRDLVKRLDTDIVEDNRKSAKRIGFSEAERQANLMKTGNKTLAGKSAQGVKSSRDEWITKLVDQTAADLVQFDSQVGRALTLWDLKLKIRQILPQLPALNEGVEISFDIYRRFLRWAIGYQESQEIIAALTTALNQMGVLSTDTIRKVGAGTGISDTLIGNWMKTFEPTEAADMVVKVATDKGILTGRMDAILANLPEGVEVVRIDKDPSKLAEIYRNKNSSEFLRIMTDAVMSGVLTTKEAAKAVDEHKTAKDRAVKEKADIRRQIMAMSSTYAESKADSSSVGYGEEIDEDIDEDEIMALDNGEDDEAVLTELMNESEMLASSKGREKKASRLSPNEIAFMEDVNEFLAAKTTQMMSKFNHYSKDVGTIVKGLNDDVILAGAKDLVSEVEQMRIGLKNPGFYKNPKDPSFDNIGYMSDHEVVFGRVYDYLERSLRVSKAVPAGGVLASANAAFKDVMSRESSLLKAIMAGEEVQNSSMSRKAKLAALSFGAGKKEDLNQWLAEEVLNSSMSKEMATEVAVQHSFIAPSINDVHAEIQRSVKEKLAAMTPAMGNKQGKDSEVEVNGEAEKDKGKKSMKDIALGTVKSDMKEIALRTGVKRTRAILAGRIAEFWAKRSTPQKIGESDADYQARLRAQTEGIGAFLVSDAGQNVLSYAIGFSWPLLEDRIPDPKVREYGAMVAREMRIQGGTELLDGFLVEVAMPLLGVLTEEAKNFGQMAMGIGGGQEQVRVDSAATAKDLAQDQEMAALKARLKQLEESRDHAAVDAEAKTANAGR